MNSCLISEFELMKSSRAEEYLPFETTNFKKKSQNNLLSAWSFLKKCILIKMKVWQDLWANYFVITVALQKHNLLSFIHASRQITILANLTTYIRETTLTKYCKYYPCKHRFVNHSQKAKSHSSREIHTVQNQTWIYK